MKFNYCNRESTSFNTKEGNDYEPNFIVDNQLNNYHEEIDIPEVVEEDNQSEVNFDLINDLNVNDKQFKKHFLQEDNNIKSNINHNIITNPINIFTLKKQYESAPKNYQKRFINFLTKYGDNLIQSIKLPTKKIKKFKLQVPNLSFISHTKKRDNYNYNFLSFTVQDIFYYVKTGVDFKKNPQKNKNKILIDTILDDIGSQDEDENEQFEEVKMFFKMALEEAYKLFEESEEFKKYAMDPKTILLDKEFKKKNNFSLLEKNGFIKYIKMCNNI